MGWHAVVFLAAYFAPLIIRGILEFIVKFREAGILLGYLVEPKGFKLKFEERPGLEVTAESLELGEFLNVVKLAGNDALEAAKNADQLFVTFANALMSWNVEKRGPDGEVHPVPPTLEGLHSLQFDFVLEIVMAWVQAMGGVDSPLKRGSSNGATNLESSMPMSPPS